MQITIIPPNIRPIIHLFSDVNIRINRISKKCGNKQKDTKMSIHFLSCIVCNVINRDNSSLGFWTKGGQKVYSPQKLVLQSSTRLTSMRSTKNYYLVPPIKILIFDNFKLTNKRQISANNWDNT
jgi:hypothetical protein